ncbi:Uncharacterized protein PBTT_08059 [Plasmodiophora brassicae]|uniref:Uncharacterized protein n=1 Tax=Plasmodiophora brassicae TaxID=37360 RepID=A0A0G4IK56_PLABS|nr:hypothetical protein PBRA_004327 [Plasmodiophora brassicae]
MVVSQTDSGEHGSVDRWSTTMPRESGVSLFELKAFFSADGVRPSAVAAHRYGDGTIVLVSAGMELWMHFQPARARALIRNFPLPAACNTIQFSPCGSRFALMSTSDRQIRIMSVRNLIRGSTTFRREIHVKDECRFSLATWWRKSHDEDFIVMPTRAHNLCFINIDTASQDSVMINVPISSIQPVKDGTDVNRPERLLIREPSGAYHWVELEHSIQGGILVSPIHRFQSGALIELQHVPKLGGDVFSVYTEARGTLDILPLSLKGQPMSSHIVPKADSFYVYKSFVMCISSDRIQIVSLPLSDVDFEPPPIASLEFNIELSIMQTVKLDTPCKFTVISSPETHPVTWLQREHPRVLTWSSSTVWKVFPAINECGIVDLIANVSTSPTPPPLPQIALLAVAFSIPVEEFFEFVADRILSAIGDFTTAFHFYCLSNAKFPKLVSICRRASRDHDIVAIIDQFLETRSASISDKHRCELSHCQFLCLLYAYAGAGDGADPEPLFEFVRRSPHLNLRHALTTLLTTADLGVVLKFCHLNNLVDDYLDMCEVRSPVSEKEIDFFLQHGYAANIMVRPAILAGIPPERQVDILCAAVAAADLSDTAWTNLAELPFQISSPTLLVRLLQSLPSPETCSSAAMDIRILTCIRLFEFPGALVDPSLGPDRFVEQLRQWQPRYNSRRLISLCLKQQPSARVGAAILQEAEGVPLEAALNRLRNAEGMDDDMFVNVLLSELDKIPSASDKCHFLLLAQQVWLSRSASSFEDYLRPFISKIAPLILNPVCESAPWVTTTLLLEAMRNVPHSDPDELFSSMVATLVRDTSLMSVFDPPVVVDRASIPHANRFHVSSCGHLFASDANGRPVLEPPGKIAKSGPGYNRDCPACRSR